MTERVEFFVSYTSADRPWAEWIAWELERAGHSVIVQAWDMLPGANFVLQMDDAVRRAERTVAVLSPAFCESPYCRAEWAAAFAKDPTGGKRRLVPVRVREFSPDGLLAQVTYVDIVGLSERASREALLTGVKPGRGRPSVPPPYPGAARPESGAPIFNVPITTRTFFGRASALAQLAERLSDDQVAGATQVHAIHGLGGVGKTQLVARFARLHRDAYDVIWWLRAAHPAVLRADFAALAVALGLVGAHVDELDACDAARRWLECHGRWLLIFDNATSPHPLAGFLPEDTVGHVLITSRAHANWTSLDARPLSLDVWEREESCAFLTARTDGRDEVAVAELCDVLGDLPLALEQAASYASELAISPRTYLGRLRDRAPELFSEGRPVSYAHTVATVWQLAFEQVRDHPVAARLAGVCAHGARSDSAQAARVDRRRR